MSIHPSDILELKRLSTNSYNDDKKFLNRIIAGINDYGKEVSQLRSVITQLEKAKETVKE